MEPTPAVVPELSSNELMDIRGYIARIFKAHNYLIQVSDFFGGSLENIPEDQRILSKADEWIADRDDAMRSLREYCPPDTLLSLLGMQGELDPATQNCSPTCDTCIAEAQATVKIEEL